MPPASHSWLRKNNNGINMESLYHLEQKKSTSSLDLWNKQIAIK